VLYGIHVLNIFEEYERFSAQNIVLTPYAIIYILLAANMHLNTLLFTNQVRPKVLDKHNVNWYLNPLAFHGQAIFLILKNIFMEILVATFRDINKTG
jgi:hypothetical protein